MVVSIKFTFSERYLLLQGEATLQLSGTSKTYPWGLRVYLDMYESDFPKSTSKSLFGNKVVRKHGFRCFTAMCTSRMQFLFQKIFRVA